MNRYTIEHNGLRFTVEAPDEASAMRAISAYRPEPAPVQGPPTLGDATQTAMGRDNRALSEAAAVGRGALDTATFGLADELTAAGAALNPVSALIDWATGSGRTMSDRYNQTLEQQRGAARFDENNRGGARFAGQIGGAVALPIGAGVSSARGLAALGAGMGGAYGFGSGEGVQDRLQQGALGAAIGGVAAPVIGAGVNMIGRTLDGVQSVGAGLRGMMRAGSDPEAEAARRAGTALRRDLAATGMSADDAINQMRSIQASGAQPTIADTGAFATGRELRRAVNLSPEAQNAAREVVDARFVTQSDRGLEALRSAAPGTSANVPGSQQGSFLDALRIAQDRANATNYRRAYASPAATNMWDDTLAGLSEAPAVQTAIRDVLKTGRNYSAALGHRPIENPFVATDDGIRLATRPDGTTATPNLQFWDYVKRKLDDEVEKLRRSGSNEEARIVGTLRNQLRDHLDARVPEFATARAGAARLFGAEDAYEAGRDIVGSAMRNDEFRANFAKMSDLEKRLFREGFVDNVRAAIREIGDNRDATINRMFSSPAARERMEIALGRDGANRMEMWLRHESIMNKTRAMVAGNSTTAQQAGDMATGAAPGSIAEFLRSVASHMRGEANERVATEVARLLTSSNPADVRRILDAASKQPRIAEVIRQMDAGLGRLIGSGSGGTAGALTPGTVGGVIGARSEEERPR